MPRQARDKQKGKLFSQALASAVTFTLRVQLPGTASYKTQTGNSSYPAAASRMFGNGGYLLLNTHHMSCL